MRRFEIAALFVVSILIASPLDVASVNVSAIPAPGTPFDQLPNPTGLYGYIALHDQAGNPLISADATHQAEPGLELHFKSITGQEHTIGIPMFATSSTGGRRVLDNHLSV